MLRYVPPYISFLKNNQNTVDTFPRTKGLKISLRHQCHQLEPQGSEAVFKAIQSLSKQGLTVIMVEHKVEKIAAYSARVMLLDQGKLIAMDTPQAVFSRPDLEKYGVVAPTFTRICKQLGMKLPGSSYYPVTLEEASQLLAKNRGGNV